MDGAAAVIEADAQTYNTPDFNSVMSASMISVLKTNPRAAIATEVFGFLVLLHLVRLGFDQIDWRYAGPLTLATMLPIILIGMHRLGVGLSHIGIRSITWSKGFLPLLPQTILAFILIGMSGLGMALLGEALGIGIFTAEQPDPQDRWGNLRGNTPLFLTWLAILWFAGPAEEVVFRGYLISRLRDVFGRSVFAYIASVALPAIIFGLGHVYYQGWRGFFVTGTIGITLGILFLLYRRNLWPLMIAHAAFNSILFTATYFGADF